MTEPEESRLTQEVESWNVGDGPSTMPEVPPGKRIGCAFCFGTINDNSSIRSSRQAVRTQDRVYYHLNCFDAINHDKSTTTVSLPLAQTLDAIVLRPKKIGLEIDNSLDDTPIGISESEIVLRLLRPQNLVIRNNKADRNVHVRAPEPTVPWLNTVIRSETSSKGDFALEPGEQARLALFPHVIRPLKQKYHLSFDPGSYVVVHSNGSDMLVLLATLGAGIIWFFSFIVFTLQLNALRTASSVVGFLGTSVALYFLSVLVLLVLFSLLPSLAIGSLRMLSFSRKCNCLREFRTALSKNRRFMVVRTGTRHRGDTQIARATVLFLASL